MKKMKPNIHDGHFILIQKWDEKKWIRFLSLPSRNKEEKSPADDDEVEATKDTEHRNERGRLVLISMAFEWIVREIQRGSKSLTENARWTRKMDEKKRAGEEKKLFHGSETCYQNIKHWRKGIRPFTPACLSLRSVFQSVFRSIIRDARANAVGNAIETPAKSASDTLRKIHSSINIAKVDRR